MRFSLIAVLLTLLSIAVFGCASTPDPGDSGENPSGPLQDLADEIIESGGLAAVGIGESSRISMARMKAKERGRAEIAHVVQSKIDSLRKDFMEEVGEGEGAEVNALFSSVSKNLATQKLVGSVPKKLEHNTQGGVVTAYALMVVNPKVVLDTFKNVGNTEKALYTRFRASQAFDELEEEVEKYNQAEKEKFKEFISE